MATTPPRIAHYEIVRRLGHGGMGTVYLGRDPDLDRNVAIKVLREPMADDELLQRFLREARATARLRHENLVTIYQVGDYNHQPFIAMEYVDGRTLAEIITQRQALPLVQKISFLEQICAGLHHAHRTGIVHRDIKPANVMVDSQDLIRILDFGIARVANSGMTSEGTMIGTLNYMSPEQMIGRPVDYHSDIFSVGAVAYELLSYQQAFPGSLNDGLLQRLPHEDPARLTEVCPGLPVDLEGIVGRALAKRPSERFGDLEEMRVALRHTRREMDPHLEVETVLVPSRGKPKSSARAASSQERRGLLERRARQIALHRDAARTALAQGDLDGAIAACEDALTLDPDDGEASQLLVEIQQQWQKRDQESKERRDRERSMRQHVADAEGMLLRGDVVTAARMLERVFEDEARDPAALTLLAKVREAATAAGVKLPATLSADVERQARAAEEPARSTSETDSRGGKLYVIAAAAVVVLAIGGGALWWSQTERTETAAPITPTVTSSTPAPAPVDANRPTPAPDPGATTVDRTPAPTVPSLPPSTPGSAASTSAAAPPPTAIDALAAPLARITQLFGDGNLAAALTELERLGSTNDTRVTGLARSVARSAALVMDATLAAAVGQKAAEFAPAAYASAEQTRSLADAASNRSDYVRSGRQALAAADAYRLAEREARAAAVARAAAAPAPATNKPAAPPTTVAAAPTAVSPTLPAPTRVDPPSTAAASPSPAVIPNPVAADPGILRALDRYQAAYRRRDVEALQKVFPSLPRETGQRLNTQFKNCGSFDVTFGNFEVFLAPNNPSAASVSVLTKYACQPKTRQAAQPYEMQNAFTLRKVGEEWFIQGLTSSDPAASR